MKQEKCGYIAIVGRPNVGKSTLLNLILGKKISITSEKPQTTRFQILGIKTTGQDQAIYIDTPGLHPSEKRAMNRYMNRLASSVIPDADVILFVIEADQWEKDDEMVLEKMKQTHSPVILVVNKIDKLKDKKDLLPIIDQMQKKFSFAHIVPLSATKNENIGELEKIISQLLPAGPHLFPDDQLTDKNVRFQIAELIREKLFRATGQEVPYSTTVVVELMEEEEKVVRISAIIWVEREGQRPIVIGKNGERLKKIGTQARLDIEKLLEKKVFLKLWVKIKDQWTNDEQALQSLGYQ